MKQLAHNDQVKELNDRHQDQEMRHSNDLSKREQERLDQEARHKNELADMLARHLVDLGEKAVELK